VRIIGQILVILLDAAIWLLVIRAIMSWVRILAPRLRLPAPVQWILDFIERITEPPLNWLRRYVRPMRTGAVSLDLSFMVWFVVLLVAQRIVVVVFF